MQKLPLPAMLAFDRIPVATILIELDGTIVAVNAAACRMAVREVNELVGHAVAQVMAELGAQWSQLIDTIRRTGEAVDEVAFTTEHGIRTVQIVMSIIEVESRSVVQAFGIDVTARKDAEDAAGARAGAESEASAKLRLDSLGLVAGGIAHDFNNLLVGVLAEASAAREDTQLGDAGRESLRRIEAAARRMAQLTRQLLAYSGRGRFVTMLVDPDGLLGELAEQLSRTVRPELILALKPGAGAVAIEADPGLLRQVVVNLVVNASDAGGTRVDVTSRVLLHNGASWWQLEVTDDGSGIAAPTLPRIFEPFFSTKPDRHGLGLSAVHGVVRRLGGDIDVDSQPGHGARFRVRLPIVLGAEVPRRQATEQTSMLPKLGGVRVLVADDEPSVRATVRRLLERRGATVVIAADGREAEARIRDERFGLIVADVSMPGLGGYEVLAIARATQPDVPVLLMSGYTERLRGEGGEDEPDAFLEKPFTARTLDGAINDLLRHKL